MSSKISVEQLNANTATYAIGDFRKMVNYENVKNKGYVRFTLGSDGGLKLEKFNRKIDLPLSWRSNTSAAHNRAMREKFAAALSGDLKYALDDTRTRICNMVLSPEKEANDFLLLYTVGGKDGFENRVNAKLASALDAQIDKDLGIKR